MIYSINENFGIGDSFLVFLIGLVIVIFVLLFLILILYIMKYINSALIKASLRAKENRTSKTENKESEAIVKNDNNENQEEILNEEIVSAIIAAIMVYNGEENLVPPFVIRKIKSIKQEDR